MKQFLTYFLLLLLIIGCESAETKLPEPDVYEVKNIGLLSTTEYTVGKIIQLDDIPEEWYKYGDRKILMSCKAKIKAGVDLDQLKDGDIEVNGNTVTITLPPAQITSFSIDPKDVRTEMESVSGFRHEFSQKEKNNYMRQGELAIRKDILSTGIIKDAESNAETFVKDFYHQQGFEKVIVQHKEGTEDNE